MHEVRGSWHQRLLLVSMALAMFLVELDFFAFNVALPAMARELGTTVHSLQWIISGYQLALGATLIAGGRLGYIFGRRRTLIQGLLIFGGAAVGAGLAQTPAIAIGFRVVMGIGGALLFPVSVSILANTFSGAGLTKALGTAYGLAAIGAALGPFVGGGLTEILGWRWVFITMAPLALINIVMVRAFAPESRDESLPRRIDIPGGLVAISVGVAVISSALRALEAQGVDTAQALSRAILGIAALAALSVLLVLLFGHRVIRRGKRALAK